MTITSGIYLTGSVNQPDTESVFDYVGRRLQQARRVPDGETGGRANWVLTQERFFADNPGLITVTGPDGRDRFVLAAGTTPESLSFDRFDYADHARASYALFAKARAAGVLAPDTRFQVSIPTPLNAVSFFSDQARELELLPGYEAAARASVDEIQAVIPHSDLSVQWDLPTELATIEGWFANPFGGTEDLLAATARAASWIAPDVDLTFHLCFGDSKFGASPFMGDPPDAEAAARGGRHILPRDTGSIVTLANGLSRHVTRSISAIQAATVISWNKAAHWQPLSGLALEPETEVYLGLVHAAADGLDGARTRAALARRFLPHFGVSTECGLGRHSTAQLDEAADALAALSDALELADAVA